jgi:hypothetical protein
MEFQETPYNQQSRNIKGNFLKSKLTWSGAGSIFGWQFGLAGIRDDKSDNQL